MKKVNTWTLFLTSFSVGVLMFLCFMVTWKDYEATPYRNFQKIPLSVLNILQFPIHPSLKNLIQITGGPFLFVLSLMIDCLFYGFILERLFSLRKKRSKIPMEKSASPSIVKIDRNSPPSADEIQAFVRDLPFTLPAAFMDFFRKANGANVYKDDRYVILWPLTEMIRLNLAYDVNTYAPEFFLIGSNGGGESYAIEKDTGYIYEMPFIGMSKEEAIFINKTFKGFIGLNE